MSTLRKNPWVWAAVILTLFKLWLTRGQAIYAIGNARHDDRLFLELTAHLLRGEWLGPYDQLTLAKGPLYSIFIAGTFLLGLPLGLAQQVFYAVACGVVVRAAFPLLRTAAAGFVAYALMLWNPLTYEGESLTRLLRQHLLVPLVLLVCASLIALLLRRTAPFRARLPWAILLGFALGCVWLTREETVWVFSIVLVLGGVLGWYAWRGPLGSRSALGGLAGIATGCFALPLVIVCALNAHYYGWFGTVEFRSGDFKDAYGALTRVQVGPAYSNVPVSREMRSAIYKVSPAFAELQSYFEGPDHPWANREFFKGAEPQILGGWFMWALRDAVAHAGHTHSAGEALAYYRHLAAEVNRACDDGRLPARPPRSGFLPPWHPDYWQHLRTEFLPFAQYYLCLPTFETRPPYSVGTDDELRIFRELTRDELSPSPKATFIELPRVAAQNNLRLDWLAAIGRPLRLAIYYAVLIALAIGFIRLIQSLRHRQASEGFLLSLGMWALFGSAFAVNLLVHITSLDTQYPAMVAAPYSVLPLILIFTVADLWGAGLSNWRNHLRTDAPWWQGLRQTLARHSDSLLVAGTAALLFAARLREIHLHAGDVPFLDQWKTEGQEILLPWAKGTLSVGDFFRPHDEHLPVWTRIPAWFQTALTGRWDPQVAMTVNAALFAGFGALLVRWIRSALSLRASLLALAVVLALGASPHSWENSTWGFQSQFPLALLFLVCHLTGAFDRQPGTGRWWLAQAAGFAGLFTLGTMWAAPLAVVLVLGWTGDRERRRWIVPASLALVGLGLMLWIRSQAPHEGALALSISDPQQFLAAWLLQLGWPVAWAGAGVLLNLPLLALALRVRANPQATAFDRTVLALGVWSALQAAAIAFARSGEFSGLVSRCGDLLTVGVVANVLAILRLCTAHRGRWALVGTVWLIAVGHGLFQLSVRGHAEFFPERSAERARVRREAVRHCLDGADQRARAAPEVKALLDPAPDEIAHRLAEPGVRNLLPVAAGPSLAGKFVHTLHSNWSALALIAALALLASVAGSWREGSPSLLPAVPVASDRWNIGLIAGLGLLAGGLIFLWPRPLDFDATRRWERLVAPAGTRSNLGFHFDASANFPADRLEGAAGLPDISLRNLFYGTHIDGPADKVSVATEPFAITGPYLVVPVAGYPCVAGNELLLRVSDPAGHPLTDLHFTGTNPRDIDFWNIDLRAYRGKKAQLLLRDNRADEEAWLAVAPPHFSSDANEAAQLRALWQLERSAPARISLAGITGLCASWLAWTWIARRRTRQG